MTRIALNGLGRIGKLALRRMIDTGMGERIVLLNDAAGDAEQHALLIEFDSVHGRWPVPVAADGEALVLDGRRVPLRRERTIAGLALEGVDLVIDATGAFKTQAALAPYLDAGVRTVVVSAPVRDG
ncbi:MAG: glyceraldehyde-3-phosphate dehydrogenase, partial [Paracoccaceae bacterium]|nr:glyceraldehyde-3-phosphate dehydrogenase [Paracoccaceae bacterium]